jgi:hypothetical protein
MNDLQPENPDSSTLLAKVLERHGWEVRSIDIDLVAGRATVEIHRFDGRWVYLAGSSEGSVNLERWARTRTVSRYRGGPECDSFKDQFLGRSRPEGLRSGLRALCNYIADNPAPGFPALGAADVRRLMAPLLSVPPDSDQS